MALGVALRFVMEALQKPHGSKMYYFGILALDRFKSKLKDYPRYCQHIVGIEHFQHFPPHLAEVNGDISMSLCYNNFTQKKNFLSFINFQILIF